MFFRRCEYSGSTSLRATPGVVIVSLLLSALPAPGQRLGPTPTTPARQTPTTIGHGADTNTGSGLSGGQDALIAAGGAAAVFGIIEAIHLHNEHKLPNPDDFAKNGPKLLNAYGMNHFIVDGVIAAGWPVALDFTLEGAGTVHLDITTADKVKHPQVLTTDVNGRGIAIFRPGGLPDRLESAVFDIESVGPNPGDPPPVLRVYGIAVGPRAVGSIGIDQVSFGPSQVKMNQAVQYGFHSHSDFSNVQADFMLTGRKDNQVFLKQDDQAPLSPATADERAQGSLNEKGKVGQHMLQIRAWRGNSGDWVVAWSPDVVTLFK